MAQFEIISSANTGEISLNYVQLKNELGIALQRYDYEVTEANMTEAKQDRAKLNKLRTALDNKRKEIKAEYSAPLKKFEDEMKDLTSMAKEASDKINSQVRAFEEKEKQEKKEVILEFYKNHPIREYADFEKIFDDRWLNKTCKDWEEQIEAKYQAILSDLEVISSLPEEDRDEVNFLYLKYLDVKKALQENNENKAYRERLRKREEELKKRQNVAREGSKGQISQDTQEESFEELPKERIVAEMIADRSFFDAMNLLVKQHRAKIRVLERG